MWGEIAVALQNHCERARCPGANFNQQIVNRIGNIVKVIVQQATRASRPDPFAAGQMNRGNALRGNASDEGERIEVEVDPVA